ncbi:hypothetical protein EO94_00460 [Methanosarcina sp. 2.H.T.1A.3]|nr:hypothetical protein EO97_14190 [Methanosarcina sp. 2.H.T.1A.15]KKG16690.1 hypothetical protein EO94_00460 [Methanosarcina sp. 2.H.T.1A.3]KKG24420.1 hypothetical protein EO96_14680 [Methanosarcina sp. 2.H.T.1A.8]
MSENKFTIDSASCFFVVKGKGYRVIHILQNFRYTVTKKATESSAIVYMNIEIQKITDLNAKS